MSTPSNHVDGISPKCPVFWDFRLPGGIFTTMIESIHYCLSSVVWHRGYGVFDSMASIWWWHWLLEQCIGSGIVIGLGEAAWLLSSLVSASKSVLANSISHLLISNFGIPVSSHQEYILFAVNFSLNQLYEHIERDLQNQIDISRLFTALYQVSLCSFFMTMKVIAFLLCFSLSK